METIFLICAIVGGTVMLCQFLLSALGVGHGHDADGHDMSDGHDHAVDHEHEASWYIGVLTFRAIVAAITFFGLGGMAAWQSGAGEWGSLVIALGAGAGAMFLVAAIMKGLNKLQAEGTVRIDRAVGLIGTVYLSIPGQKTGPGKVHLNLQNRTVEYLAVTALAPLSTGTKVRVIGIIGSDTVEVVPATEAINLENRSVTHG